MDKPYGVHPAHRAYELAEYPAKKRLVQARMGFLRGDQIEEFSSRDMFKDQYVMCRRAERVDIGDY